MTDDTTAAMDHLRESCAIAAGKRVDDAQVTCWETGESARCRSCGNWCWVVTDGCKEWTSCVDCETVTVIP